MVTPSRSRRRRPRPSIEYRPDERSWPSMSNVPARKRPAGSHLAGPLSPSLQAKEVAVRVGEPFPALVLPAMADGSPLSIEQFRGKKVLLHQFASW